MSHYVRLLALLSITLPVAWQLLLISYNVKVNSHHIVIALVRVLMALYITGCVGSLG